MSKSYGKVKVKRVNPKLQEIPEDCGYECQFEHNIDMNSNGIMGDCIEWCQKNCEGKWGWWFEQNDLYDPLRHNWEEQSSYMSFEKKLDATKFWLAIGVTNMGNKDR
tara:strand:- start:39 stop:359 length:321 start_codon:yes stop_codon:yes gene_type:complete